MCEEWHSLDRSDLAPGIVNFGFMFICLCLFYGRCVYAWASVVVFI